MTSDGCNGNTGVAWLGEKIPLYPQLLQDYPDVIPTIEKAAASSVGQAFRTKTGGVRFLDEMVDAARMAGEITVFEAGPVMYAYSRCLESSPKWREDPFGMAIIKNNPVIVPGK